VDGHLEGCLNKAIAAGVDVLVTSGAAFIKTKVLCDGLQ
jgi:hypothetical protein